MAKTPAESPADRAKRELAEKKAKEQAEIEAAQAEQPTQDSLTDEEAAALAEADAEDELAQNTIREVQGSNADTARASRLHDLQLPDTDAQETEDPAIVAERRARFARAEAFERQQEQRRAAVQRAAERQIPDERAAEAIFGTEENDGKVIKRVDAEAFDFIYRMAVAMPMTTPNEHVLCGYGPFRLTVGHIRKLANVSLR